MEALFDARADTFCLVTSDSDFAYLCRKLKERGATVNIVGEAKSPDALRNASDQFFEWALPPKVVNEPAQQNSPKQDAAKKDEQKTSVKHRPKFVVDAVKMLAADTLEGKVQLGPLGTYLRRTYPSFSPQVHGHSGLLDMLSTYDMLTLEHVAKGPWLVRLADTVGK